MNNEDLKNIAKRVHKLSERSAYGDILRYHLELELDAIALELEELIEEDRDERET